MALSSGGVLGPEIERRDRDDRIDEIAQTTNARMINQKKNMKIIPMKPTAPNRSPTCQ